MKTIGTTKAVELIKQTNGRIFTVHFVKKNGEHRRMNCRLGVKKYLTGEGMRYNAQERGLLPVYDIQAKGYRMINLKSLIGLTVAQNSYLISEKL